MNGENKKNGNSDKPKYKFLFVGWEKSYLFAGLSTCLFVRLAVHFGSRVIVDQWCGHIHQHDGESDAIRVTAPAADDINQCTDAGTINPAAFWCGAGSDRVGGNKESA